MTQDPTAQVKTWPILATALVLRLTILALVWSSTAQLDNPMKSRVFNGGDSEQYITLAENIVEHGAFSLRETEPFTPNARRTPGYPVLLAFLYIVAGHQHDPILIVACQVGLSLVNVWLTIQIGTKLFSPRTGWLAGWLYAFAPVTLVFTGLVMTETLFATLLLLGTLLCVELSQSGGRKVWFEAGLAGIVFASMAYTRPIALYFVPIPLLALLVKLNWSRRGFALGGIMLLGFLATVAPWFYRNYTHFNAFMFTSIGNQNLLLYNVASIEAQRQNIDWRIAKKQLTEEYLQRLEQEYDIPTLAGRNSVAGKLVLEHISRHPFEAFLYQTLDMINLFRPGYSMTSLLLSDDGQQIGNEVQAGNLEVLLDGQTFELASYAILTIYYLALYIAVFFGTAQMLLQRNSVILLLIGLTTLYFLYLPGKAGNARFRAPVEGYLAIIGAVGLIEIIWEKGLRSIKSVFHPGDDPVHGEV